MFFESSAFQCPSTRNAAPNFTSGKFPAFAAPPIQARPRLAMNVQTNAPRTNAPNNGMNNNSDFVENTQEHMFMHPIQANLMPPGTDSLNPDQHFSMYAGGMDLGMPNRGGMGMQGSFANSIPDGRWFTGSLYGGALYGSVGVGSMVGSMHPMTSMYDALQPHTSLGSVRAYDKPFSYTFGSTLLESIPSRWEFINSYPSTYDFVPQPEESKNDAKISNVSGMTRRMREKLGIVDCEASTDEGKTHSSTNTAARENAQVRRLDSTAPTSIANNIHTLAFVETSSSNHHPFVRVIEGNMLSVDTDSNATNFMFEEVVVCNCTNSYSRTPQLLRMLAHHTTIGHNTALLLSHSRETKTSCRNTILFLMKELFENLESGISHGKKFSFELRLCSLNNGKVKDLLKSDSNFVPSIVGGSPLVGPMVVDLAVRHIQRPSEIAQLVTTGVNVSQDNMVLINVVIKQVITNTDKPDVLLSSLTCTITPNTVTPYMNVFNKVDDGSHLKDILRYAIGGPCVTVAAICVNDSIDSADLISQASQMAMLQNVMPRSGSVRCFVERTEFAAENIKGKIEQSSDSQEKKMLENNALRLDLMLKDCKAMLENPEGTEMKVYHAARRHQKSSDTNTEDISPNAASMARESEQAYKQPTADTVLISVAKLNEAAARVVCVLESRTGISYKQEDDTHITIKGEKFDVDEICQKSAVQYSNFGSNLITDSVNSFADGYNVCLTSFDSPQNGVPPFQSPTWAAVRAAICAVLTRGEKNSRLRVAISLLKATGEAADLIGQKTTLSPLVIAASPLFGPVVHHTTLSTISSEEDFEKVLKTAQRNLGTLWAQDTVLHTALLSSFSQNNDFFFSSFVVTFAGENSDVLHNAMQHKSPLHKLLGNTFSRSAMSMVVMSLHPEDDALWVSNVFATLNATTSQKRSIRRGSVKTFVNYTKALIAQRREVLNNTTDPAARENIEMLLKSMERMLKDHISIMADPNRNPIVACNSDEQAHMSGIFEAEGAENQMFHLLTSKPSQTSFDIKIDVSDPLPIEGVDRVMVAFVEDTVPADPHNLTIGNHNYAMREILPIHRSTEAATLADLQKMWCKPRNCALFSAGEFTPFLAKEPVFAWFRNIMLFRLKSASSTDNISIELSMCIVTSQSIVLDLLGPPGPKYRPLGNYWSPIWGARVKDIVSKSVTSNADVNILLKTGFQRVEDIKGAVLEDALLVATALCRLRTPDGNDILLNSLTAFLSKSSCSAYKSVIQKRFPVTTLMRRMISGGIYAVSLLKVTSDTSVNLNTATCLYALMQGKSHALDRSPSIKTFLTTTLRTLEIEAKRVASITESIKKEMMSERQKCLFKMARDHQAFLEDMRLPIPQYLEKTEGNDEMFQLPAYLSEFNVITTIITLTGGLPIKGPARLLLIEDDTLLFESLAPPKLLIASEIVFRPNPYAPLRSEKLKGVIEAVVNGYNGALILFDLAGTEFAVSLVPFLFWFITSKITHQLEVFWSLVTIKNMNSFKDMLGKTAPTYQPLTVSTSPFFSNTVEKAEFKFLQDPNTVNNLVRLAYTVAQEDSSMMLATFVFKYATCDGDVILCSFTLLADASGGAQSSYLIEHTKNSANSSKRDGILYSILNDNCTTAALLDTTTTLPNIAHVKDTLLLFGIFELMVSKPRRNGSLKLFINFCTNMINDLNERLKTSQSSTETAVLLGRLNESKKLLADTQALLACDEKGVLPPRYS